jgi:hypothetical protein
VHRKDHSKYYFTDLLRCVLAVGSKWLGQAAREVRRGAHHVEQRQVTQLETAVDVVLHKNIAAHHHDIRFKS